MTTAGCRAAAGALALIVAAVAAPSTAAAAADDADPWLAGLARELRRDPVFVSDSVSRAVSAGELARLRADVAAMPVPTRVALVSGPPNNGEVRGIDLFEVPDLLAGAIDRPGLYVVVNASDDSFGTIQMSAVGVRPPVAPEDAERAVGQDVAPERRVVTRVRYALRVVATGDRPSRGVAKRELDAALAEDDSDDPAAREDAVALGFAVGGGLAGFAFPTFRWWRRRPRRTRPLREAQAPPRLREPGAAAAARASDAVARLAAAIQAAPQPSDEAFDLYSAASKAEREARTAVDSVGALILAEDGEAALAGRPRPKRCFFDPEHRGATTTTRWRLGDEEAEVPACGRCAEALRDGRAPDALGDRGEPYFKRDSVWARTGFGAIDDELAARVLAGR